MDSLARNLREALAGKLSNEEIAMLRAFDLIGDIAVMKIPEALLPKKEEIGRALMEVHPHVKTVLNQTTPVSGQFRTRGLEVIAGEPKTLTVYRENGCFFKVDLATSYFSPRLATERMRIAKEVKSGEVVTNLFAGVGCYSIVIAKWSEATKIYSIDINPAAYELMVENVRLNRVGDRVVPILGDSRKIVEEMLVGKADRVLMPLPELGREFFGVALDALKSSGGMVHFYDFGSEPDVFGPSEEFVRKEAAGRGLEATVVKRRKVRSYAPRCYHIVLDVMIGGV
ncbi:MAG: class I SAM-dependent methyltransferase family protein [Candidatus Hadarchaeales archaeon]